MLLILLKQELKQILTPHVLRASTVTYLKGQGFSDGDIMKVTGHASSKLIYAYDKGSRADNASKKVSLVRIEFIKEAVGYESPDFPQTSINENT